jgi:hypothetical protein
LPKLRQALFVDIDDGDRPCGLHPGIDELESIESSDPKLLDRRRIGDPEGRERDQERQADQPGIPESPRKPSQYPRSLHAFSDVSFNRNCPEAANWGSSSKADSPQCRFLSYWHSTRNGNALTPVTQSTIRKGGSRFSEKIMLNKEMRS